MVTKFFKEKNLPEQVFKQSMKPLPPSWYNWCTSTRALERTIQFIFCILFSSLETISVFNEADWVGS